MSKKKNVNVKVHFFLWLLLVFVVYNPMHLLCSYNISWGRGPFFCFTISCTHSVVTYKTLAAVKQMFGLSTELITIGNLATVKRFKC